MQQVWDMQQVRINSAHTDGLRSPGRRRGPQAVAFVPDPRYLVCNEVMGRHVAFDIGVTPLDRLRRLILFGDIDCLAEITPSSANSLLVRLSRDPQD